MITAQYTHLRAPARAGRLDGGAGLVEDMHVRHRAGCGTGCAHDFRAYGADRTEVVADTSAAAHGFCRVTQGMINARFVAGGAGNRVSHRLYEAIN